MKCYKCKWLSRSSENKQGKDLCFRFFKEKILSDIKKLKTENCKFFEEKENI